MNTFGDRPYATAALDRRRGGGRGCIGVILALWLFGAMT